MQEEEKVEIRSQSTLRRIEYRAWRKRFREEVFKDLVKRGPCTARDIFNDLREVWYDSINVHTVSCALVDLKAEGRAKSSRIPNDINKWEAVL